jgi:hypothetical protein
MPSGHQGLRSEIPRTPRSRREGRSATNRGRRGSSRARRNRGRGVAEGEGVVMKRSYPPGWGSGGGFLLGLRVLGRMPLPSRRAIKAAPIATTRFERSGTWTEAPSRSSRARLTAALRETPPVKTRGRGGGSVKTESAWSRKGRGRGRRRFRPVRSLSCWAWIRSVSRKPNNERRFWGPGPRLALFMFASARSPSSADPERAKRRACGPGTSVPAAQDELPRRSL